MSALSKYKTYPEYKDSGVEWLGDIPSHWLKIQIKNIIKEHSGNGFPNELQNGQEGIPFLKVSDISGKGKFVDTSNNKVTSSIIVQNSWNVIPKGSIIAAKIGEALRKNHRKILLVDAIIDNNCIGIESINISNEYNYYIHQLIDFDWYVNPGAIPSLSVQKYKSQIFFKPSLQEQTKIAQFLDHETAKIDQLIDKQQTLIELLKEKRQAVISHAVTKGLDPNVKMKDSGVEWLDEVPEHWGITKLKYKASIFGRIGFRGYTVEDIVDEGNGALVLSPSNVQGDKFNLDKKTYLSWKKYYESPEIIVAIDDILLVKTGSTYGKSTIISKIDEPMTINPQMTLIKKVKIPPKFLYYLFQSNLYKATIDISNTGSGMPTMTQENINNFPIPIPLLNEFHSIYNFLDIQTSKIDLLIQKVEQQIALIKERRTALISAAVTGKIDVRDWQPEQ